MCRHCRLLHSTVTTTTIRYGNASKLPCTNPCGTLPTRRQLVSLTFKTTTTTTTTTTIWMTMRRTNHCQPPPHAITRSWYRPPKQSTWPFNGYNGHPRPYSRTGVVNETVPNHWPCNEPCRRLRNRFAIARHFCKRSGPIGMPWHKPCIIMRHCGLTFKA